MVKQPRHTGSCRVAGGHGIACYDEALSDNLQTMARAAGKEEERKYSGLQHPLQGSVLFLSTSSKEKV